MKKIFVTLSALVICLSCGCTETYENSDTQFLFDTVVTLTADCDDKTLESAFSLCRNYEYLLSRNIKDSDVYKINHASGECRVSDDTAKILKKAIYYGDLSNGKFDITIYPVSSLWDFSSDIVPSRNEIAEALKNVDYQSIALDGNTVNAAGRQIDLGGIAKGYIADRVLEHFKQNNVNSGIIDLGGNLIVWGNQDYTLGVKKPFSEGEIIATVGLKNKSVVTSGVYERYIKQDGKLYHHILDPKTGYACDTDLYSATIIGDSSIDCDALSTICMLLGLDGAKTLIENTKNTEAIFVDDENNLHYTDGLTKQDGIFVLK
ncbi:MAG: FAD:protein FMN transferase [Clostridia bacterium]|nr:FAD:protein FMN transferase [Clostridia bacterium]